MSGAEGSSQSGRFNLARYFVTHPQVAWVLLLTVLAAGVLGYAGMPKRKDPEIPVRVAMVAVGWPGASAQLVEESITRRLEAKIAENEHIDKIESTTRTGVALVKLTLSPDVQDTGREFDDVAARLATLRDLPRGSSAPQFMKDFGSTVALMLTVASPPLPELELELRTQAIAQALTRARADQRGPNGSVVFTYPVSADSERLRATLEALRDRLCTHGGFTQAALLTGPGFAAIDGPTELRAEELEARANSDLETLWPEGERHPDLSGPFAIRELSELQAAYERTVPARYSFRELDDFSERLEHRLQRVAQVSKVARVGLQPEQLTLEYSQEKLGAAGIGLDAVAGAIATRNVNTPAGVIDAKGRSVALSTNAELTGANELSDVFVAATQGGAPVRLGDLFDVEREYQSPRLLNRYTWRDERGAPHTARAVTLAISMRSGAQIEAFGQAVDAALQEVRPLLPEDLILARTSDQPQQVRENVALFNNSLYEAIVLVVIVALVGFLSWRTAAILALAIPITLAMTYGVMRMINWDLQQISISSMILALGLLVDVPVVASDAIVSGLARGEPRERAAWQGPTRLATAILFATLTNVIAYLPFLAVSGDIGRFIRSLPIVMTIALLAAYLLSLTFVPMLGAALLRAPKTREPSVEERRRRGFGRVYSNFAGWAIAHRRWVVVIALALVAAAIPAVKSLKTAFFPKDLSYLSYVDVWAPEDSTLPQTKHLAEQAAGVIDATLVDWGNRHPDRDGKPRKVLHSITTFVGGGGPRFWFSVTPEQQQPNYAQLIIQVNDKHDTNAIVGPLQAALASVPGARIDVRQLETGKPVGVPVSVRIAGEDIGTLRGLAERASRIFSSVPLAERVRDDWGNDALGLRLQIDPDRAAAAGVSHQDVATSSAASNSGQIIGALRDEDRTLPIVARLRPTERAGLSDLDNLYVNASRTGQRVPLAQVASTELELVTEKIQRRNHERTITVACFPRAGHLPSEVMTAARPQLEQLRRELPPGYSLEIGGEEEEQIKGFRELSVVLLISILGIFVALAIQFKSAVKPMIVFATIPFGVVGALVSLRVTQSPFGFMAFLGIISLIGVIVSHVIVLFDFIEERREHGAELEDALVEAGIQRLRPVLITVVATVIALIPLAMHGGPLWEPLCYAQIGGLSIATVVTLVIVPVVYALFVKDLKWLRWERPTSPEPPAEEPAGLP